MSFLNKLFGSKKDIKVVDYQSFWDWFLENENAFFETLKSRVSVNDNFVQKVMDKLGLLNKNFYCLAGMYDDYTAELVITPEGMIKEVVFVEDLIASAPQLERWKFTALKPPTGFKNTNIEMDGYSFSTKNISFYSNQYDEYPDEIDITIVHNDYNENDKATVVNGCFIFLDNALGELTVMSLIDSINIKGPDSSDKELISIEKLEDFLVWREKEFVEKYDGVRRNTESDNYSSLEATDEEGHYSIAMVNLDLLKWDTTASHPWMLLVKISYNESKNNGMPDDKTYNAMNEFEDRLTELLPDFDGYLNLGHDLYKGKRNIYFACREFRNSSRRAFVLIKSFENRLQISYDIYKDKYWATMNQYRTSDID